MVLNFVLPTNQNCLAAVEPAAGSAQEQFSDRAWALQMGYYAVRQNALNFQRRLVEAGVPFVSFQFEGNWDHHGNNFGNCRNKLPNLDNAVASLIEDLDERGLLDRTIVAVLGLVVAFRFFGKMVDQDAQWERLGEHVAVEEPPPGVTHD